MLTWESTQILGVGAIMEKLSVRISGSPVNPSCSSRNIALSLRSRRGW